MQPIFIFSLPRSGSTLLQKILSSHEKVDSTAETWILLNCLAPLERQDVYANYNFSLSMTAINDFVNAFPNKKADFLKLTRNYILGMYSLASKDGIQYFVDKTPRYHLIIPQIYSLFPNAKFIFLFRNPLSILASIIETWGKGEYNLYKYNVDLYAGFPRLISSYNYLKSISISINYEDLVTNPQRTIKEVCGYLNLEFDDRMINDFKKYDLKGHLGDNVGIKQYNNISSDSLEKWKKTLNNPYRKIIIKRYLNFLGKDRIELMGYDYKKLVFDLHNCPLSLRYFFKDVLNSFWGYCYNYLEFPIFKNKLKNKESRIMHHR